jgi:hypothetical protein
MNVFNGQLTGLIARAQVCYFEKCLLIELNEERIDYSDGNSGPNERI